MSQNIILLLIFFFQSFKNVKVFLSKWAIQKQRARFSSQVISHQPLFSKCVLFCYIKKTKIIVHHAGNGCDRTGILMTAGGMEWTLLWPF